jgi:hypothetical protein
MKEVDPKTMSVEELKALAYDLMVELTRTQNNLKVIETEIINKQQSKPVEGEVINY